MRAPDPETVPMPAAPLSCIGYVRVSTEQQAEEGRSSLDDQEQAIRELAERLGTEVGRWFRDAGASGATVEGRPAFLELLRWCEEHTRPAGDGWVLVLNDSRFGRFPDPDEAAYWRHHLSRHGWVVRFAEGDDVAGDFRTVVRAIGSVQASEYLRNLTANVRRGMKGSAEQGYWTRRAPYGYRRRVVFPPGAERVLDRGQRKAGNERVKLTPHEDEAEVVRWAFETYAGGGESLSSLAEKLRRRDSGRRWGCTTTRALLRNHAYRGAVVGGRRRTDDTGELYGCEDAHPALVSQAVWSAVQARLARARKLGKGARSHYLLTGIMRCIHCGQAYTGGGGGRNRRFYRDSGGVSGACSGRIGTVMRHLVDDSVVELLGETIATPAVRERIERTLDEALAGAGGVVQESETRLKAARARAEQQRDRLVAAVADGTLLGPEARDQLERIRAQLADIEAQLQALRFAEKRAGGVRAERDRLLRVALDFPSVAARVSGPALRALVEPWLARVTFDKVARVLTLGIRTVPALPDLLPYSWQEAGDREEGVIVRTIDLLQPGHVVETAAEAMREAR